MASIREQIMLNRFAAVDTLTDFLVRKRVQADMFAPPQFPALFIYPAKETKRAKNFIYECELQLVVEISVQISNENADEKLNELLQLVEDKLQEDASCGGLAKSCYQVDNDFAFGIGAANGRPDRAMVLATWLVKYDHKAKNASLNL